MCFMVKDEFLVARGFQGELACKGFGLRSLRESSSRSTVKSFITLQKNLLQEIVIRFSSQNGRWKETGSYDLLYSICLEDFCDNNPKTMTNYLMHHIMPPDREKG